MAAILSRPQCINIQLVLPYIACWILCRRIRLDWFLLCFSDDKFNPYIAGYFTGIEDEQWCWWIDIDMHMHSPGGFNTMAGCVASVTFSPSCSQTTGPWFNIKMLSYQYRKSHYGDKTVVRSSYLHNGISYTGKMVSFYWMAVVLQTTFSNALSWKKIV